jgi:hypothetical protein
MLETLSGSLGVNLPDVPDGIIVVSIQICPCNTRVNALISSAFGSPKCYITLAHDILGVNGAPTQVLVTSVVPSLN